MWQFKRGRFRIHGGSTSNDMPKIGFKYRSKHFAVESPLYYVHVGVTKTRHTDRDPDKTWRMVGSGRPEKYLGNVSLHATFALARTKLGFYFDQDYGRKTYDYAEFERNRHNRVEQHK